MTYFAYFKQQMFRRRDVLALNTHIPKFMPQMYISFLSLVICTGAMVVLVVEFLARKVVQILIFISDF